MPNVEHNNGKTFVADKLAETPLESWTRRLLRLIVSNRPENCPQWLLEHARSAPILTLDSQGQAVAWSDESLAAVVTVERRSAHAGQRGAIILETAVALIVLTLLCLGFFDLNRLALAKQNTAFIASECARCLTVAGCDVVALAQSNATGLGLDTSRLIVTVDESAKTATVSYRFNPFGPLPVFNNATVTSIAAAAH